jgi:hypothetical protein
MLGVAGLGWTGGLDRACCRCWNESSVARGGACASTGACDAGVDAVCCGLWQALAAASCCCGSEQPAAMRRHRVLMHATLADVGLCAPCSSACEPRLALGHARR